MPSAGDALNTTNMNKPQTPKKWFGQRHTNKPFQPEPRIVQREIKTVRFLKKTPYKATYAEFTYTIQPVANKAENVSYIAARMLAPNGRVHQPLHEYELSRRFPGLTDAENAWTAGFEVREDYFLARTLVELLVDEEAAERISATDIEAPGARHTVSTPASERSRSSVH